MNAIKDWLDRQKRKQASGLSWADRRRNEALEMLAGVSSVQTWLELSSHDNGFVREIAVRELCRQPSPEALAALLERLNDWAPQVREVAAAGLEHYLHAAQAQALLFALKPLMALARRHRTDHGPTLLAARAVLQASGVRQEVYEHFLNAQGQVARYLFALLLEDNTEPQPLLRSALAHRELTVRLLAVAACQACPAEQARPLLLEALSRPGAKVRVTVLRALLPMLADPRPVVRMALLDASPAIRNLARWAATRHAVDARAVFSERLATPPPTGKREWLGVLGLASELDVALAQPWHTAALQSPCATVRQAAVRLLRDEQTAECLAALDDPADRVFYSAIGQLDKQPWATLQAALDARLDRDWHSLPSARQAALMQLRPAWQQLAYLLRRLTAEPAVQAYWLRQVEQWCDRQYQVVDPVTPKAERAGLVNRLRALAADRLIRPASVARVAD